MEREFKLLNEVLDSSVAHPIVAGTILIVLMLGWFAGFIASLVRLLNQHHLDATAPNPGKTKSRFTPLVRENSDYVRRWPALCRELEMLVRQWRRPL